MSRRNTTQWSVRCSPADTGMSEKGPVAREVELSSSAHAIYEHFYDEDWTDSLPIVPRGGQATVEKIAIN